LNGHRGGPLRVKCERGRWLATSACGMHPEWRVSKHAGGQDYGFATEGVWRSRNQHVARVGCHSNATERCSGIGSCLGVSGRVRSSDTGYGWQTSSSSVVSGVQIPCLFSGFRRRGASGELLAQGKVRLWCALLEMGALLSHAPMVGPMGGLPASEWREALQAGDYSNGRSDGQMLDRTHCRVKRRLLNCNQRAKASRYGGTHARRDIAFECDTWLNPKFKL